MSSIYSCMSILLLNPPRISAKKVVPEALSLHAQHTLICLSANTPQVCLDFFTVFDFAVCVFNSLR